MEQQPAGSGLRPYLVATMVLVLVLAVAAAGGAVPSRHTVTTTGPTAASVALGPATGSDVAVGPTPAVTTPAGQPVHTQGANPVANTPAATPSDRVYDPGVTDTTITVGGSTFTSGPAAVYGDQIAVGFAAGVDYINTHGGINGRRVILKLYDDGGDPTQQLTNTKRLVEVDKVFALAMVYQPETGAYIDPLGIPVFHEGQFDSEFFDPNWFSMGGPQSTAVDTLAHYAVRTLGVKSAAVFYINAGAVTYSKQFADQVANVWRAYGVQVPVEEGFGATQTSCSDALTAASNAKVDFIDFEIDASKVVNCGVQAQIQGYKPPKSWGGYLIGVPVMWQALGDESIGMIAEDAFGALYNVPDYKAEVAKISPKTDSDSSVTAAYFYAALLMRDGIAKLGNHITRAGLKAVLNTFTDWRPGLTDDPDQPSWTWTLQCHIALRGGYIITVRKHADGSLAWDQSTPQLTKTFLPPGQSPPPALAGCPIFTSG